MKEVEAQVLELVERLDQAQRDIAQPFPMPNYMRPWLPSDREKIQKHYEKLCQMHSPETSMASDISDENLQWNFLMDFLEIGDLKGQNVLDIGCGSGIFLKVLRDKGIQLGRYLGLDQSEVLVKKAREVHPESEFHILDCFDGKVMKNRFKPKSFDYVLSSGIFGVRPKDWSEMEFNALVMDVLGNYLNLAKKGLAFNFIPVVYSPLKRLLEWKEDSKWVSYHRMNRVQVLEVFGKKGIKIRTLVPNLTRVFVQFPVFLVP